MQTETLIFEGLARAEAVLKNLTGFEKYILQSHHTMSQINPVSEPYSMRQIQIIRTELKAGIVFGPMSNRRYLRQQAKTGLSLASVHGFRRYHERLSHYDQLI